MKITFIAQASIVIETEDCAIWTDPWLFGTAFNDSWKLFPKAEWDEKLYEKINYLWVSHEHPDHFHFPTLKSLPQNFKERVTLLFQDNNSNKMPDAFQKLGFKNIRLLKNRKIETLTENTRIHNCQIGQMDSSLAVITDKYTVLNLNDCEVNSNDAKRYVKDLGKIDVVLNQFSIAGYNGHYDYQKYLPDLASNVLQTMVENHRDLNAKITIPIASYVYFCKEDNKHINDFANTPADVDKVFRDNNLQCRFLSINETIDLDNLSAHDSQKSLEKLTALYSKRGELDYDKGELVSIDDIKSAFMERHNQMKSKFSEIFFKKLGMMKVFIPDHNKGVKLSLSTGMFEEYKLETSEDFDIQINSQPLFFSFKFKWGLQTLGVSARYLIRNNYNTWKWYRILTSMNNAEIYLTPKYIFSLNNIKYLKERFDGGINQLKYQLVRMGK